MLKRNRPLERSSSSVPHSCPAHLNEPYSISPVAPQPTVTPEHPNMMSPYAGPWVHTPCSLDSRTPDAVKIMSSGPMTFGSNSSPDADPAVMEDEPVVIQGTRASLFKSHVDLNQETTSASPIGYRHSF